MDKNNSVTLVGKIDAENLKGVASIPEWLQPYVKYNGVWVGTEEPPEGEDWLVWINPEGQAEGSAVLSFNTRTGHVMPEAGDYNLSMVGAEMLTNSDILDIWNNN